MKKIFAFMFAAGCTICAMAEGYQVNTLSARQGGMGHTGVALHLDAESMFFNPAGMGFMTKAHDASFAINMLKPYAKCKYNGRWYESDNNIVTPLMFNFGYSINEAWKIGVSVYTPYGSGINWGRDWPGSFLNQKVKLQAYTVQPTLAWKVADWLSVGAGLTMSWGDVNLDKGLIDPTTFDKILAYQQIPFTFGEVSPASANLKGQSQLAWGANVGVMIDVTKNWTIGASYRTEQWLKVHNGTARVSYANEIAQQALSASLNGMHEADFDAKMPMPWVLSMGTSVKPAKNFTLTAEANLTGWNTYKSLDVTFSKIPAYDQHITKDYHNSWVFRLGAEWNVTEHFDARIGCALDQSPINEMHYNPETPGMRKLEPSIGFSYNINEHVGIDVAGLYVHGMGVDNAVCDYEDLLVKAQPQFEPLVGGVEKTFKADYKVSAINVAVGVHVNF